MWCVDIYRIMWCVDIHRIMWCVPNSLWIYTVVCGPCYVSSVHVVCGVCQVVCGCTPHPVVCTRQSVDMHCSMWSVLSGLWKYTVTCSQWSVQIFCGCTLQYVVCASGLICIYKCTNTKYTSVLLFTQIFYKENLQQEPKIWKKVSDSNWEYYFIMSLVYNIYKEETVMTRVSNRMFSRRVCIYYKIYVCI